MQDLTNNLITCNYIILSYPFSSSPLFTLLSYLFTSHLFPDIRFLSFECTLPLSYVQLILLHLILGLSLKRCIKQSSIFDEISNTLSVSLSMKHCPRHIQEDCLFSFQFLICVNTLFSSIRRKSCHFTTKNSVNLSMFLDKT